eukprot:scaffold7901_cov90-Cylindrotheca_fusiformis.AAC.2
MSHLPGRPRGVAEADLRDQGLQTENDAVESAPLAPEGIQNRTGCDHWIPHVVTGTKTAPPTGPQVHDEEPTTVTSSVVAEGERLEWNAPGRAPQSAKGQAAVLSSLGKRWSLVLLVAVGTDEEPKVPRSVQLSILCWWNCAGWLERRMSTTIGQRIHGGGLLHRSGANREDSWRSGLMRSGCCPPGGTKGGELTEGGGKEKEGKRKKKKEKKKGEKKLKFHTRRFRPMFVLMTRISTNMPRAL